MEQTINIKASLRATGKGAAHQLRKSAQVPAILYGPKVENTSLCILQSDAVKYTAHGFENSIFSFDTDEKSLSQIKVLVKNVDRHPGTHLPIHIDFYAPDMAETVRVNIEIKFDGKAAGEGEGGLTSFTRHEIEVECLPGEIPENVTVDISSLELNGSLHVSDIKIPSSVKLMTSPDLTIATCAVVAEEPETPVEAEVAVEGEAGDAAAAAPAADAEKK